MRSYFVNLSAAWQADNIMAIRFYGNANNMPTCPADIHACHN